MCEVDSADIAARIKAAIKAKLVEMEAYVDDELPDYIMVMIANKKTKDQMLTDLNLFLGQNTPKFVDWIHEVLHRLQTITLDMKKKEDHKEGRAKTHRKIKKARTTKSAAASGETSKSPGSDSSPKQIMDIPSESTSLETAATSSSNNQEKLVLESAESLVAMSSQSTNNALEPEDNGSAKPPEQQDVLAIRAEDGDDFGNDDEVETIEDQSVVSSTQPSSTTAAAPVKSTVQKTYEESPGKGEKRGRTVNSTIGAVVSREEEEEEYDPRRPAIGTVASIVRTQRSPDDDSSESGDSVEVVSDNEMQPSSPPPPPPKRRCPPIDSFLRNSLPHHNQLTILPVSGPNASNSAPPPPRHHFSFREEEHRAVMNYMRVEHQKRMNILDIQQETALLKRSVWQKKVSLFVASNRGMNHTAASSSLSGMMGGGIQRRQPPTYVDEEEDDEEDDDDSVISAASPTAVNLTHDESDGSITVY